MIDYNMYLLKNAKNQNFNNFINVGKNGVEHN